MRAFIIRPFGIKNEIDFDAVEAQLIAPALEQLQLSGRTTLDILRQGNIRVDMFQRLLTADLVIADVSIHNANVFYELGIRHALRDKRTFLLRCEGDKIPFDLFTDRYLVYQSDNPGASLSKLIDALTQTLNSEEPDSPVFQLLPDLEVQDRSRFLVVPRDFREEVERAARKKEIGNLELLQEEVHGFSWESEGFKVVGRSQFDLGAVEGARKTWEAVLNLDELDQEANEKLATIYQRLGDLTRSEQALKRALASKRVEQNKRAELLSLLGRNAKIQWRQDWCNLPLEQWRTRALVSPFLDKACQAYTAAFHEDLNHFYSGLNTLALLTIQTELASQLPDVWSNFFDTEQEAKIELNSRQEQLGRFLAAVNISIAASKKRLEQENRTDIWVGISGADLLLLTSKRPARVANEYQRALADAPDFVIASVLNQINLYKELDLLNDNVAAALSAIAPPRRSSHEIKPKRFLLFTGHMIDAPGRQEPRFPADKEDIARQKLKEKVEEELKESGGIENGIAGGASGGDILFHEVCAELGIPTQLYLAVPRDLFIAESVLPAGPQWIERFNRLYDHLPMRVLSDSKQLPRWLRDKPDYSIWQRNNLWMLYSATAYSRSNVTLIALWSGEDGDGPGGTGDLVQRAKQSGIKSLIINTKELFGL